MKAETIKVKSKDHGEFEYVLEQPESLQESVDKFGVEKTMDWLLSGRKADVNADEWSKIRGTKTVIIEVDGAEYRVNKDLVAVMQASLGDKLKIKS